MPTNPALADIFNVVNSWHLGDDVVHPSFDGKHISTEISYTRNDFKEIHPYLQMVLFDDFDNVSQSSIKLALEYWNNDFLVVPLDYAKKQGELTCYAIKYFESIKSEPGHPDVKIECQRYNLGTTVSGVQFPYGLTYATVTLSRIFMDENIPKWEEKSLVAQSLELDPKAFTNLLFDDLKTSSAEIPTNLDL